MPKLLAKNFDFEALINFMQILKGLYYENSD
jgi:hypothetical protein